MHREPWFRYTVRDGDADPDVYLNHERVRGWFVVGRARAAAGARGGGRRGDTLDCARPRGSPYETIQRARDAPGLTLHNPLADGIVNKR